MSPPSPDHPVLVEVDAKRVDAGDEHVEPEVELVPVDEKGVGDVALHNYRVFLLHLLLLLRVHFDLARNLRQFRNESTKRKIVRITLLGESITHAPIPHMLFGSFTMYTLQFKHLDKIIR